MIIADTNILLDLITADPTWSFWSENQLEAAAVRGPVVINDVIYAELAGRYKAIDDLNTFIDESGLTMVSIPRTALFLAAKAYYAYRKSGGVKSNVLPDFFIGAHAASTGIPLLTRDVRSIEHIFQT